MKRKIHEWLSKKLAKKSESVVIFVIFLFNILFFLLSAVIISRLSLSGTEKMGFLQAAFCTIMMILDPGCIQFVIDDIGHTGVILSLACLFIIIVGMISFTGAIIGYVTNYISEFIRKSNSGYRKLVLNNHVVILNWNSRASEIINDFLYCKEKRTIVVLVDSRKDEIEKEIAERLEDTINRENRELLNHLNNNGMITKKIKYEKNKLKNKLTIIVRVGDVYSSKQLHDISLEYAEMVIILGNDINNSVCKYANMEKIEDMNQGNPQTVKTLMQVSDIVSSDYSSDDQKIIVEITDDWTKELVDKIIQYKQVEGKCNIVPICINQILGQILSQFSLMPELNLAYRELFSNKGVTFFARDMEELQDSDYISQYFATNKTAIPLTLMNHKDKCKGYFSALTEKDITKETVVEKGTYSVSLNQDYWIEKKTVIILGHNSKCKDIMKGFAAFRGEWNYKDGCDEILSIIVIDDTDNLEKMNYYSEYPFVTEIVEASVYDKAVICSTIERIVENNNEDTSVLILSDDSVPNESIDANALANLVYVQDIINEKKKKDSNFDVESIDIIVEIINPKHHDIVSGYSVDNVVISNRYISKMITQIGEKEELFNFYTDILTYDAEDTDVYESKEIYIKKVSSFFKEVPKKCKASEFIRAVYEASADIDKQNLTITIGYVKPHGEMILFGGNQDLIDVELEEKDKLIVFSNH